MAEDKQLETEADAATAAEAEDEGDNEGFGSAFAERASGGEKEPDPAGEKPAESEPADKAGSEAAPSKEADESDASGTASKADPWKDMTPEQLRAEVARLQASERSQRGRVGALTKKLNHLTKTAATPSEGKKEEAKTEGEGEEAQASDLEARLDEVADKYDDVNGPVIEAIKEIRKEIAEMKPKVDQVDLDKDAADIAEAREALEEKHPDVAEIEESPDFVKWATAQPQKVKDLLNSYDPNEVSLGLSLYKAERKIEGQAAEADDEGEKDGSTATDDKRKRQLDGSKQVRHRGAPAASGVPNEFGTAFKARAQAQAQA